MAAARVFEADAEHRRLCCCNLQSWWHPKCRLWHCPHPLPKASHRCDSCPSVYNLDNCSGMQCYGTCLLLYPVYRNRERRSPEALTVLELTKVTEIEVERTLAVGLDCHNDYVVAKWSKKQCDDNIRRRQGVLEVLSWRRVVPISA